MDWKRKLTSRKLWLAVADFVGMLMLAFGAAEAEAAQVTAIIMAGAGVVGYLIAEGLADYANGTTTTTVETVENIEVEAEGKE